MGSFIVRRLITTVVVLVLVTILTFFLLQIIPGDPVATILGPTATPEQIAQYRHELSLDRPLLIQYGNWVWRAFHGDLGKSVVFGENVTQLIADRLPITAYLSAIALVISAIVGIFAGVICAVRRGGIIDSLISLLTNIGMAVPTFWLGILGIYILGLKLGWLPIQGFTWPTENFGKSMLQIVMPVFCLAVPSIAIVARQTRSSMLEIIQQDYIRTAISKGLAQRTVVFKHALRNALIPIVTLTGIQVRLLVGGAVLTETVFSIPGMGRLLVRAAFDKDYLIVQGGVLFIGIAVCLANLLVDLSYSWIDPRIRYG